MNTRIQELARKAFMLAHDANDLHVHEHGESIGGTAFENIYTQKFAELIIEECAGIYEKIDNGNSHMGTDNYLEALRKFSG